ncbi:MAG: PGPGW domain-containing protein [Actinomycetes bacterium]
MRERAYKSYRKSREKARGSKPLDLAWRAVIFLMGLTLLGLGILFLVFPGPGWPILWIGLVVLATEFAWANRFLEPITRFQARVITVVSTRISRTLRKTILVTCALLVLCALYFYVRVWGFNSQGLFEIRSWVRAKTPWS